MNGESTHGTYLVDLIMYFDIVKNRTVFRTG